MGPVTAILSWMERHPARAGAAAGWFQQGMSLAVAILLIPVVNRCLPPESAGVWFSYQSLAAMMAMLDLGFGLSISRQAAFTLGASATAALAGTDFIRLQPGSAGILQLHRLTRRLYLALALVCLAAGVLLFEVFSRFGNLIPAGLPGARPAWYAMLLAVACLIYAGGSSAFLNGLGSVSLVRTASGAYLLLAGTGAAAAAWCRLGLAWMAACHCAVSVLYCFLLLTLVRQRLPKTPASDVPHPPPGALKQLARAALPLGAVNVFGALVYTVQPALAGAALGPAAVAPFYLAQKIGLAAIAAAMHTVMPQLPFFTRLLGAGNPGEARRSLHRSGRIASSLVIFACLVFPLACPVIARVMLGGSTAIDPALLWILAADFLLLGLAQPWAQFVLASGRNPFVLSTILHGIFSLALTLALLPALGIIGAPLASLAAGIMTNYTKSLIEGFHLDQRLKHANSIPSL